MSWSLPDKQGKSIPGRGNNLKKGREEQPCIALLGTSKLAGVEPVGGEETAGDKASRRV